jgi:hypothetical protein
LPLCLSVSLSIFFASIKKTYPAILCENLVDLVVVLEMRALEDEGWDQVHVDLSGVIPEDKYDK